MPGSCRVQIVERGGRVAKLLRPLFAGRITTAGSSLDYADAVDAIAHLRPQVVIVDLDSEPIEATAMVETLMAQCPTPVLLLTGPKSRGDAFRALAAGALEVVERPRLPDAEFFKVLTAQVLLLSKIAVLRHVRGRKALLTATKPPFALIAIAASLGGPKAVARVLGDLPKSIGAAIVICQHITAGFSEDLSRWLRSETGHDVVEAVEAMPLVPGRVFVAGSNAHLLARSDFMLEVDPSAPVGGFRPSCDVLLGSAASSFKEHAIGVVLTGMGRDGARGLKEIRSRGGHTIAQDEGSSVVFGMPGEAIALGAAEKILPLDQIGLQLERWL